MLLGSFNWPAGVGLLVLPWLTSLSRAFSVLLYNLTRKQAAFKVLANVSTLNLTLRQTRLANPFSKFAQVRVQINFTAELLNIHVFNMQINILNGH